MPFCGKGVCTTWVASSPRFRSPGTPPPGRRWAHNLPDYLYLASELGARLLDLFVGVVHDRGGTHRVTSASERFVGLDAEDSAQVGDRVLDPGCPPLGERVVREPGDDSGRLVTPEPVKKVERGTRGLRADVLAPESWKLRMATVK